MAAPCLARAKAKGKGRGGHRAVIQATLIFILGFLSAVFLAALVAPAIWRRAVALTRRRVEASLPLSLNEIGADKDALRAEYAMAVRKLEVTVKALKEKIAAQSVEVGAARDEARRNAAARDENAGQIAELEAQQGALRAELVKAEKEIVGLGELLAGREALLDERKREIARLGAMYDEASFDASNRQIELVAQEARLDDLAGKAEASAGERDAAQAALRAAQAAVAAGEERLRGEERRIAALERNAAKLTASLTDREEKLERRQRDLERARAKLREAEKSGHETTARLAAEQDVAALLRAELETLRGPGANKRAAARGKATLPPADMALLRERIDGLAAEMVSLTARLEGPDSPIPALLAAADEEGGPASLAARIRALRKAEAEG